MSIEDKKCEVCGRPAVDGTCYCEGCGGTTAESKQVKKSDLRPVPGLPMAPKFMQDAIREWKKTVAAQHGEAVAGMAESSVLADKQRREWAQSHATGASKAASTGRVCERCPAIVLGVGHVCRRCEAEDMSRRGMRYEDHS